MAANFTPRADFKNALTLDWCHDGATSVNTRKYPFWFEDPPGSGQAYFAYVIDLNDNTHSGYADRGASFVCGFLATEGVLISKYQGHTNSVNIQFDPPISAIGACVGGDGAMDQRFFATLEIKLDNGTRVPLQTPTAALFTRTPGKAPFVGAKPLDPAAKIVEAWFDLKFASNIVPTRARCDWIGIGPLLFIP